MAYRNDHDAALVRFEAELERERLRADEAPATIRQHDWLNDHAVLKFVFVSPLLALVTFAIVSIVCREPSPPQLALDRQPPVVDRALIRECVQRLAPNSLRGMTDMVRLRRNSAPCREELHTMASVRYESQAERDALWAWARREAELSMAMSRLEQLRGRDDAAAWDEYEEAYAQRNVAALDWLERFGQSGRELP